MRKTNEKQPIHHPPAGPTRGAPSDGFNVLPDGVTPTGSAYGGIPLPPSAPGAFIKQSFEEAQKSAQASAIAEKKYLAQKKQAENKIEKTVDDDQFIRNIHEQIKIIKEKNKAAGIAEVDIEDLETKVEYLPLEHEQQLPDELIVQAKITGRLEYEKNVDKNLLGHERRALIQENKIDLSTLAETKMVSLALEGVTVDLSQLKHVESLTTVAFTNVRVEHLTELQKAHHLKYFFFNSELLYDFDEKEREEFSKVDPDSLTPKDKLIMESWDRTEEEADTIKCDIMSILREKPLEVVSISGNYNWYEDADYLEKAHLKFVQLPSYFKNDSYPLFINQPLEVIINFDGNPDYIAEHIKHPSFIGFTSGTGANADALTKKFMERHPEIAEEIGGKNQKSTAIENRDIATIPLPDSDEDTPPSSKLLTAIQYR